MCKERRIQSIRLYTQKRNSWKWEPAKKEKNTSTSLECSKQRNNYSQIERNLCKNVVIVQVTLAIIINPLMSFWIWRINFHCLKICFLCSGHSCLKHCPFSPAPLPHLTQGIHKFQCSLLICKKMVSNCQFTRNATILYVHDTRLKQIHWCRNTKAERERESFRRKTNKGQRGC